MTEKTHLDNRDAVNALVAPPVRALRDTAAKEGAA
jgi:hypothetical protein